ncbi:MAG: DPP IV N-terminal domain-containing protein [Flavobacteriales bacterium]
MKKILLAGLLLSFFVSTAQKNLTLEQAISYPGSRTVLTPKKLNQLKFTQNPEKLSYTDKTDAGETLVVIDKTGKKTTVATLAELNNALKTVNKKELTSFPEILWVSDNTFKFLLDQAYWAFDVKKKNIIDVKEEDSTQGLENADFSSDRKNVAYTRGYNLFVRINGLEKPVSTNGTIDLVYGQSVHREEFGIHKGTFFSPAGNYLAFYKMDQSMVTSYPIINWNMKPAKNTEIKYPFAGNNSHRVTLGIYNLKTAAIHYIKTTGDPEQYLTNIAWSNDETKIYIAIVNRAQNEMKLNEYDAATGNFTKALFEEKDEKYIEPLHEMEFLPNKSGQFIWQSNRDGYKHLYLYDANGTLIKQLTQGEWEIKQWNGFDKKGENFFFHANVTSPVNQDFCMVNLKSGQMKVITNGNGFHQVTLNTSCTYGIDVFSNTITPRVTSLLEIKSGKTVLLYASPNPVEGFNIGKLKLFTIKNKENTDLYCRMFYPHDFDSTKKYPVVVYLYNGPHSQLVTNSWLAGADLWYHYMAQHGFIVFTLDGRGTDNRGKKFSQAIHRQIGTAEMEDQLCGADYLKKLSYVNGARMGVHGWSYGGFMTTSLMTRHAGVFKAGVCGGPVIDWSYYEIMYGERYMDTPQENKAGYDGNNLLNYIGNLKGKLLVIHGTDDDVVVWQHSLMLLQKSVEKNVQVDYYVYPGHQHNVRNADRLHLMDKISKYFIENL